MYHLPTWYFRTERFWLGKSYSSPVMHMNLILPTRLSSMAAAWYLEDILPSRIRVLVPAVSPRRSPC